jgi:hypothetical protein
MAENDSTEEIEAQIALVVAALGIAFAETLVECCSPPNAITTLRMKVAAANRRLLELKQDRAAAIFAPFMQALFDPKFPDHR